MKCSFVLHSNDLRHCAALGHTLMELLLETQKAFGEDRCDFFPWFGWFLWEFSVFCRNISKQNTNISNLGPDGHVVDRTLLLFLPTSVWINHRVTCFIAISIDNIKCNIVVSPPGWEQRLSILHQLKHGCRKESFPLQAPVSPHSANCWTCISPVFCLASHWNVCWWWFHLLLHGLL